MELMWLRVRAPFAAFRGMQAGAFRATMPVMPPSAAHGLVLNLAGIEARGEASGATTRTRPDVPAFEVALGVARVPEIVSLFQQLHGYPVGASSKELKAKTFGAKYHIAPVRRELLVDLDLTLGVRNVSGDVVDRVRRGLIGALGEQRYGLPFAGDNNLLIDRIDVVESPSPQYWFERISGQDGIRPGSARLTVGIDRASSVQTVSMLHAPTAEPSVQPPAGAWTWTPRPPG